MQRTDVPQLIKDNYRLLCNNYQEGQEIIFIGFSRGAFICRCIASLMTFTEGLIGPSSLPKLDEIIGKWELNQEIKAIRKILGTNASQTRKVRIKHLILFDPVASVREVVSKEPGHQRFTFVDSWFQEEIVDHVSQALALHEHRQDFMCIPITEGGEAKTIDQMWFSGFHSNVGGSARQGVLALFALAWMMGQIKAKTGIDLSVKNIEEQLKDDLKDWNLDAKNLESKTNPYGLLRRADNWRVPAWQQWKMGKIQEVNKQAVQAITRMHQIHVSVRLFVDAPWVSGLQWPKQRYTANNFNFDPDATDSSPREVDIQDIFQGFGNLVRAAERI